MTCYHKPDEKTLSYPLRSGEALFDDSGDKQPLDSNIFIHSCYLPQPAILIFGNSIGDHVYGWRKVSFFMSFFPFGLKRHYSCVP